MAVAMGLIVHKCNLKMEEPNYSVRLACRLIHVRPTGNQ